MCVRACVRAKKERKNERVHRQRLNALITKNNIGVKTQYNKRVFTTEERETGSIAVAAEIAIR